MVGDTWHDQAMRTPIGKCTCRLEIASRGMVYTDGGEHTEVLGIGRDIELKCFGVRPARTGS